MTTELHQLDFDLCKDSKCVRFENELPKCDNCPYIPKDKYQERVKKANLMNAFRIQNKLK